MRAALTRYAPLLLVALVWEAAPRLGLVRPDTLPPLSAVAAAWVKLLLSGDLARQGLVSLQDLVAGLGIAIVVGVSLGVLMAWYQPIEILVNPLVRALYPLPRSALIPVMILWLGIGAASKIASVFLGCLLPVVLSAYNGARGVDQVLVWSALAAGASRRRTLWEVVLPAAMPEILAGVRNALALSFILLVAAEFVIGQSGLGYLISFLGEGGAYDAMFAGVVTVSAVGFFADRLYLMLMGWLLRWRE
ncbi:MAG TPA: ABC transporter permease [Stellaceae bacterium]|nr:ABC transporter permease [Stellaceae bacterium]